MAYDKYVPEFTDKDGQIYGVMDAEAREEVADLKNEIGHMTAATLADEGKALKAKTVNNGKVAEWEFGEAGGGMTATQANLLLTILGEGVYGSDQEANIELLRKALLDIAPVSISAVLESTPLVGLYYSDLEFTVTATFDDESTMAIDGYRIVTPGAVVSGSNTVTLAYRGVTTDVIFAASSEQTYTINYNLTDASVSNKNYLIVAGERYETVLAADEGHYISSVIVTMGGTDITSTAYISGTQTIMIPEVTGDVSITVMANVYIYMDDLLFTRDTGFSNCNGYPNESTSESKILGGAYYFAPFVAEYPALHDCVVHWKITNNTENDLALNDCGFGSLDTYGNNIYSGNPAIINAFNCVKADNLSHKLTAGESLEGDVFVKAGWSLCFICRYDAFASFGIELVGNYEPNTFEGYAEIAPTQATAPNFGNYRDVSYYSDDGNTLIKKAAGYPAAIKTNIEPGTYDVYYATKAKIVPSNSNLRRVYSIFGGMKQNTDTDVYFAGGLALENGYNIWFHTQFVITENDMTLIGLIQFLNLLTTNDPKLSILYKKVVTE